MNKLQLAEWMHDNYEQLAKSENCQTQEITRVKFDDLPEENKATMIALADRMLETFLIIGSGVTVSGSLLLPRENAMIDLFAPTYRKASALCRRGHNLNGRKIDTNQFYELMRELKARMQRQ